MLGIPPTRDAHVGAKLRSAGAIILGKANMDELAMARSSDNSTHRGWSGYGGQVLGAFCENQDPLGSSCGSGVAMSVGLAVAALGTEV